MQKTVNVLRVKGISISEQEENALYIAILLHDIGHGAFSHALEHSIVTGISHEEISLKYMHQLNRQFDGQLDLAISVFNGEYHRKFLHQLITSQLDIDRLDYLKRDSFYTGVAEGNISSDRLIAMINVVDNELVIEKKGIYSVEKFLIARRLMYWQVYLHKTSLVAEYMLVNILTRAKELANQGVELFGSSSLKFFLYQKTDKNNFDNKVLNLFSELDDYDVLSAIKEWTNHSDKILSKLSLMIVNRNLLKIEMFDEEVSNDHLSNTTSKFLKISKISEDEAKYFVFSGKISNQAYNKNQPIKIASKNGTIEDIVNASDQLNLQALSKPVNKYFLCYPKNTN
jgi:HD superfamily phosphohydrolase